MNLNLTLVSIFYPAALKGHCPLVCLSETIDLRPLTGSSVCVLTRNVYTQYRNYYVNSTLLVCRTARSLKWDCIYIFPIHLWGKAGNSNRSSTNRSVFEWTDGLSPLTLAHTLLAPPFVRGTTDSVATCASISMRLAMSQSVMSAAVPHSPYNST